MSRYIYPWPASGLLPGDMALLCLARNNAPKRTTITRLLAEAVRRVYGGDAQAAACRKEDPCVKELRR